MGIKKVRGTTPSLKSNQNNPNYVRIILMLQSYYFISDYQVSRVSLYQHAFS
jgi:hypothetical protein